MKLKRFMKILLVILLAAAFTLAIDCSAVYGRAGKPHFCIPVMTADDGGSGWYIGPGYAFRLRGSFTTEGYVIKNAALYILGIPLGNAGIRKP